MQVGTKFDVNQKVFCVEKEQRIIEKIPCNICNGSRAVILKGKEYKCPECYGHGIEKNVYEEVYIVHKAVINSIKININKDGSIYVTYRCIYDRDKDLPIKAKRKETPIAEYENIIFGSYEEADTYCKQMNNDKE